jgi:hypothetical protein
VKRYSMEIVTQTLTIEANSQEEAEHKYNAYFGAEPCPCGQDQCDCVEDSDDVYHITTKLKGESK